MAETKILKNEKIVEQIKNNIKNLEELTDGFTQGHYPQAVELNKMRLFEIRILKELLTTKEVKP